MESGKNIPYFCPDKENKKIVVKYIGEYECSLDNKSRVLIPARLMKQFPPEYREKFIVARSIFQECLILFTLDAWEENLEEIMTLSQFSKDADDFTRKYLNGATEVELDNANRILLPKKQIEYAKIEKDIIITSNLTKLEIWSPVMHEKALGSIDHNQFENLAETLLGKKNKGGSNINLN